ncbi:MAG TPA: alpha/beta fold hydrolase [Gemmatimonadaceae bacterium]|nr:alpha/beta fold hydrolase [Gemmatimonadaceae bacterium]
MSIAAASIAILSAAIIVGVSRAWSFQRAAAALDRARHRETNASGVVMGAEAISLSAQSDRGILLLHGFNDTPQSVAPIARALHARGWTVSAPLLPGHGRADDALERSGTAKAWIAHARSEWDAFRARVPNAVLCGQSMGGALSVMLAAEHPPRALVLLAPYLAMGRVPRWASTFWWLGQLLLPIFVSNGERALYDEEARAESLGRGVFTPRLVAELRRVVDAARRVLPEVTVPTLVVHSRGDYRIPSKSASGTFAAMRAVDKTIIWRENAGHVLGADRGHDELAALIASWLDARVGPISQHA